jgi:hypothetical protein
LLAVNAFLLTLVVVVLIGGAIWLVLGRPLFRAVNKACDDLDKEREARAMHERLEQQEEARHRVQAEQELEEQIPHLKDRSEP